MRPSVKFLLQVVGFILVAGAAGMAWMIYDGLNDSLGTANCAVIFANPGATDIQPGSFLAQQMDEAIQLYQSKKVTQIVIASTDAPLGVNGAGIIGIMSQYLTARGVPGPQVLADQNPTSLDASAQDVAAYVKQGGQDLTIMVVAPYYEVTRDKLALGRAGIGQVLQQHVGTLREQDVLPAMETFGDAGVRVVQDDVEPEARKLAAQVQAHVHGVSQSFSSDTSANAGFPAAATGAASPDSAASSDATTSWAAASSDSVPAATDVPALTGGQTVMATGIASMDIPMDWSQRIVPPIMDPVWAAPGSPGQLSAFLMLIKVDHPGSMAEFPTEIESQMRGRLGSLTPVEQGSFTTRSGAEGIRVVTTTSIRSLTADNIFYIFQAGPDKKVVLLGICQSQDAAGTIPTFDACAKTIR
jgi:hypothetical protein